MADLSINFNTLSITQLKNGGFTDDEKSKIISIFNEVDNSKGDDDKREGVISGKALGNFYKKLGTAFKNNTAKLMDLVLKIRNTYENGSPAETSDERAISSGSK